MANKAIRGITVEIGGDTTKLGKALESSETKSRSLQTELRQIEKLLKFDPGNVELLTQKQDVLKNAIKETAQKLDTLKEAEAQVIAQFERGEIAEDQLRAFQREIMQTEKYLGDMKSELSTTEKAIKDFSDGTDNAAKYTKEYKEAVKDAKQELSDFKDTAGEAFDALKTGAGVLGGAAVAAGGYALNLSTEFDKAFNTLITRTGASTEEMDDLNEAMERVYANNFGESIEDVAESMATVKTNTKLSGDELQNATERALLLRDTFEFDVNESTRSAKMLMDQYGISAEDAFNLIAQGAQNGLDKNGDLLDTINEYAVHFKQLGIDAPSMFNMLVSGAESGTFSVDKLGDAIKEFGIRAKDGSDSSREAFEYLGYDADKMFETFNKGGEDAAAMTQILLDELASMPDGVEKTTAGVALFGTMWEDLGADGIRALSQLDGGISTTNDALNTINEHKYDDIGSAIQGLGRTLETDVVKPLGEELKPVVEEAIGYVQANGPQIKEFLSNVVTKIGEFVGFVVNNGPTILSVITGVGAAFVTWKVATMISGLIGVITSFISILKTGTTVMGALNAVMNMNPIVLIVTLIAGLVVAFITLWNTSEGFRNFWINLWTNIQTFFVNAWNIIKSFCTETIPQIFNDVVSWFQQLPSRIWTWLVNVVTRVAQWGANMKTAAVNAVKNMINNVVNFFQQLPYKIGYALGFVLGKLVEFGVNAFNWAKTNIPKIINNIVTFFSQLPSKIWKWLVNVVTKIGTWGANMKTKATTAATNFVNSVVNFIKQLPSKIWTWLTNTVSKVATWGTNLANKGKEGAKKLLDAVVNTAKQIPSKMLSIGKDIVSGVWNGIKGAASTFKKNVKSFFSGIVDGAKSALGINSPSKVFAEVVGKAIPEGIAKGVVDNGGLAKTSVDNLTDDLSNQAVNLNGATINRKLAATFSAGAVETGNNAALLNRLDGIYERLNRMQIVLDTGTLVGETIDKIDAGLATRQLLSARGV